MTAEPDLIFALIERHRTASNAWFEAEKAIDRLEEADAPGSPPRSRAYADAMHNIQRAAFPPLFTTPPATIEGAIALLRYVQEADAEGDQLLEFTTLTGYRIAGLALVQSLIEGLQRHAD